MRNFDIVIYHGGCPDGFTAAWAVWRLMGENCEYLPYRYGQEPPNLTGKRVAIVDFSFKRPVLTAMAKQASYIVVLDHHHTAQVDLDGLTLENGEIIFDMNRSGAQIAWDYLWGKNIRPWFVDYVADRDLWLHQLPQTKEISQALYFDGYFADFSKLDQLLQLSGEKERQRLADRGTVLLEYKQRDCESFARHAKRTKLTVGTNVYNVNLAGCPRAYRSDVGNLICTTQECDFAGVYWYDFATREWWVSFRATKESPHNLAEIVSSLPNGGGHPKAAGFTIYGRKGECLETYFILDQ